jgi:hypothetical protein
MHESQQHDHNCFLTLTYATAPPSLSKRDHQLFVKSLRKQTDKISYYMCGEYGSQLQRPHYHYLIFGHNFKDRKYWKTSTSGEKLYRSETLEKIWKHGHAWIGDVTYESCAYVAAYVMKKINGPMAETHYKKTDEAGNDYWLQPEFNAMSRRPGIARAWWDQFKDDVHTTDTVVHKGKKLKPPRYYDKLLELADPIQMAVIKLQRETRAAELVSDNTPERLQAKETVTTAKLHLKQRQYEK